MEKHFCRIAACKLVTKADQTAAGTAPAAQTGAVVTPAWKRSGSTHRLVRRRTVPDKDRPLKDGPNQKPQTPLSILRELPTSMGTLRLKIAQKP